MTLSIVFEKLMRRATNNVVIRLFRYGLVGGAAFAVDFGLLALLTELCGLPYQLSAALSFVAGLTANYLMSVRWVFNAKTEGRAARICDFVLFALVGIVGLGLNAFILWLFTEVVGLYYLLSKIVSTIVVFFWNFFARQFIFTNTILKCKLNRQQYRGNARQ